ncbi:MAG: OmpH family outer membrane protein [Sulfuricaulis sp.]|nr:OmpH family outer membrane protein [Sulfuricaulis sp.]
MHTRTIILKIAMCLLGISLFPLSGHAAELKIGYVNAVKVIEQAPQGESALKKLEAEFAPRDKQIVEMQNRLKQHEQELEKNALVLKDVEQRSKEFEIVSLKRDLRRATQEFREDYNLRRNEELAALQKIVQKTIAEIARQENYDLVLESAVYASPKADITDKILRRLGKK